LKLNQFNREAERRSQIALNFLGLWVKRSPIDARLKNVPIQRPELALAIVTAAQGTAPFADTMI